MTTMPVEYAIARTSTSAARAPAAAPTPPSSGHGAFLLDLDDDELVRWDDVGDFPTRREAIDYAVSFAQHEPQEARTP